MNSSTKELLGNLVGPNSLRKLIGLIKNALELKIDKASIVQDSTTDDEEKVPSAAVTNYLQEQVDELNTKFSLTDVKSVNFQNSGTRSLIWLYTNDAKTEGYRIDIDGVNRYMQYASLPVTASSIIGAFYMSGIRTVEINAQTLGSADNLPGNSVCWINPAGISGGIPNLPSQQAYHIMTVYTISTTYGFQFALRHDAGVLYTRTKSGGTWGNWRQIG